MLENTRALRRASAAASAHAPVAARRPVLLIAAALIGITLSVGFVAAPAAGGEDAVEETPAKAAVQTSPVLDAAHAAIDAAIDLSARAVLSGLDLGDAAMSLDTGDLQRDVNALEYGDERAVILLAVLEGTTAEKTAALVADTQRLQAQLTAAAEKKAAEDAAKLAAEQAAVAAAALAAANTPDGARATAREMAASRYGWGEDQFQCLNSLWNKESGWNYRAYNSSGATGIPQALPGSKMSSAGADWADNAATQIAWGLGYISSVYGTPCSAWEHSQAVNWY
ncbi:phospholipase [Microbacterium sp.]|uniref:aggregation-promoting factor C-terminal-like domain-containing protein n=1 Tax=Microbacterium sp. TaxID=51671 RepID=UPI0039E5D661